MKRNLFLFFVVSAFTLAALAQAPAAQQPAAGQPGQAAPAGGEAQKKQITDPAEYNAYVAALNEQQPARKVQLIDEFLTKYPNTVVKEDALELKMVAMQQAGQNPEPAARQLLQANPNNLRALVLLAYIFNQTPIQENDPNMQAKLNDGEQIANRGVKALANFQPANISPADLEKTKKATEATFHQTLGIVSMGRKQYDAAQKHFREAAELTPEDAALFYRLGNAYISERPNPKYAESFWSFARAVSITGQGALPEAGRKQIDDYLKGVYVKYHGSEEGLDQLKQQARTQPFPPADFKVQSKAEIAASQPQEPEAVGFLQIRDTLSSGGEKATSLFERIKGKSFTMKGLVVSATPAARARTARIAVTEETANKPNAYDVELTLANPQRLSAGQMVEFEGMVNGYNPSPFSLAMVDGQIKSVQGGAEAPPPATKKAPAAKKPAGGKRRR